MDESMRKIIEADLQARKALELAQQQREDLPKELEQCKAEIFNRHKMQSEATIQHAKDASEQRLSAAKAEIQAEAAKQQEKMQAHFALHETEWKQQILQHILEK